MAHMLCNCGNKLSDVEYPSPNCIEFFYEKDILQALSADPNITLWNFTSDYDKGTNIWFCNQCGRIYIFDNGSRMWSKKYRKLDISDISITDNAQMSKFYILSDVDIEKVCTDNEQITLSKYFASVMKPNLYFCDDNKGTIYAVNPQNNNVVYKYNIED